MLLPHDLPNSLSLVNTERGFLNRKVLKKNWFKFVVLFCFIEREVESYQLQCQNGEIVKRLKKFNNFKVVPIHCSRMKHIRIDTMVFRTMLQSLRLDPKIMNERGNLQTLPTSAFTEDKRRYWSEIFNFNVIERIGRKSKMFDYQVVTDGVSASLLFSNVHRGYVAKDFREQKEIQAQKYAEIGRNYDAGHYKHCIGIDPGYKLTIAAVIWNTETGWERNIKISSKNITE